MTRQTSAGGEPQAPRRHADFIRAEIQTKPPHVTASLLLRHTRDIPDELVTELIKIGFTRDDNQAPPVPGHPSETRFSKPGGGLFGDWTELEKRRNLISLRALLRRHSLHPGAIRRLSARDCQ